MGRGSCPACGATIDWALVKGSPGKRVALEISPDSSTDADRYRIISGFPLLVELVPPGTPGAFLPDHSFDCAGGNAGRR